MRAKNLPAFEKHFRDNGVDTDGKKFILSPFQANIPGTQEPVDFVECTLKSGDKSYWYHDQTPKKRIVLHFTAGYLKGDIATLTQRNYHVSVPFVVARDGTIYNLWSSREWSYHLGKEAVGGNKAMSRSSVGIEISNIGWLKRSQNDLLTYFSEPGKPDVYCTLDEKEFYAKVPLYREKEYFATFTDEQYASVGKLVRFLAAKYDIPLTFVDESERYKTIPTISTFRGITSHVNFRPSGKWDIGPAFNWKRLIKDVGGS
ncbi:MAG TPA: N-acetylmuramoyl-L-alanine amidase [Longimicrobium sp.]|nr:N-acetylmuramoyl-L-alanine amidase [Longimicrobium sp.]